MQWEVRSREESVYNHSPFLAVPAINPIQPLRKHLHKAHQLHRFPIFISQPQLLKFSIHQPSSLIQSTCLPNNQPEQVHILSTFAPPLLPSHHLYPRRPETNTANSYRPTLFHCLHNIQFLRWKLARSNQQTQQLLSLSLFCPTRDRLHRKEQQGLQASIQHRR